MRKPSFAQLIKKSTVPVLVDFYADWCGPCKTLGPIVAETAKVFHDKIKFIKVNVEKQQALARTYNVQSIPTLILFQGERILWRKTGLLSKKELIKHLNNTI